MIDPLDDVVIPADMSKIRRNPFYEDIMKNGFSVKVNYSPEDAARFAQGKRRQDDFDLFEHDPDELAAFEEYRKAQAQNALGRAHSTDSAGA